MSKVILAVFMLFVSLTGLAESQVTKDYIETAFIKVSKQVGVPLPLLKAICWSESSFNPEAFNPGDGAGNNHAFGICQVLHSTAREYGFNDSNCYKDFSESVPPIKVSKSYKDCKLFGVQTNILYAAKYLKSKLDIYDGSWISAIAAYNSGVLRICKSGKVFRVKDGSLLYTCKKGGLLNQKYVDRILKELARENYEVPNSYTQVK